MAKNLLIALDVEPRHIDLFKAIGNLNITVKKLWTLKVRTLSLVM